MSPPREVSSWVESDGVEVWLIADSGRGRVDDLVEAELAALTHASPGAVLAANADADDAQRVAQLLRHGYRRVFSMVELERDTTPLMSKTAPVLTGTAGVGDADEMHELTGVVWAGREFFSMPSRESYRDWVLHADLQLILLARQDEKLVGYAAAREDASGLEIEDVQVHPRLQRRGIATALVARLIHEADRRGVARVWLQTEGDDPVGARRFYEQLGFRLVTEHLRFRKPVPV